ncbi:hypothetical protein B1748_30865 [Paenibacillus sp. MY03]|uniref:hypothetical protein n=1 Tax=Paenibacillus sp. MY03 TaxID=302980 RepID=UPI000B3BF503|nr:hypothetical protein [Paenibacillus sp. MY03]OUS69570.1 hypothetical protein B1748_30865 [Paenibacillus sp. MY03]
MGGWSKAWRLALLVSGTIGLNVAALSPGLGGARLTGGSSFETAFVVTLIVMSPVVLLTGSHAILFRDASSAPRLPEWRSPEAYWLAFVRFRRNRVLRRESEAALSQLERMEKKVNVLLGLLGERFNPTELSYKRFASAIAAVEELFYGHVRELLGLLRLREASAMATGWSAESAGYLGANEEILLKLDGLLAELTRLGGADYRDVLLMPCMKDIDILINQTKYYKP